jgi:DivIVA domain-containing protein
MQDETFRLTPVDVRRYDFGSALRGYDKARVEQFRAQVAEVLEQQARQLQELEERARGFHEQLRAFRERDKALNDALVTAQQLRAEMRDQAEREAQLLLREARAEADRLLDAARAELRSRQGEVDALVRLRRSYVAQMRAVAQRQLLELEAAEAAGPDALGSLVEREPVAARTSGGTPRPVAGPEGEAPAPAEPGGPAWLDHSLED